jgi:hypothetical protein
MVALAIVGAIKADSRIAAAGCRFEQAVDDRALAASRAVGRAIVGQCVADRGVSGLALYLSIPNCKGDH